MKKIPFLFAAVATVFAVSCTSDKLPEGSGAESTTGTSATIDFTGGSNKLTRADFTGVEAANLLDRSFRVYGVINDGTREIPVFDNYVVDYNGDAGSDSTNTAGWTYLGETSKGVAPAIQSVKYWNFEAPEYDFVAISGLSDATRISSSTENAFAVDQTNLGKIYVSDRVTAKKAASMTGTTENALYGRTVTLTFKRLAARLRIAFYETIPGYAVKDVRFYYDDNYTAVAGTSTKTVAGMRGKFPVSGTLRLTYDANNAVVSDFEGTDVKESFQFGELDYTKSASSLISGGYLKADGTVDADGDEAFLSTTAATPTYAKKDAVLDGETVANSTWQPVIPFASNDMNLVIRVDFTLVSLDGTGLPIVVKGASATVPVEYAKWKSNFAYTYIFKITDRTNGTTGPIDPDNPNPDPGTGDSGLYAITFDTIVSSVEDFTQETITGVTGLGGDAITTYSPTSDVTNADEYKVGETVTVSSISHGQWSVAYTATSNVSAETLSYTIIGGETTGTQTVDEASVTSASFKVEQAGYYVVKLYYLPQGREDKPENYVSTYKVVKTTN